VKLQPNLPAVPWSTASAEELAEAAGAADLFVFRRVADGRFAHIGGAGRGTGWAGIVEVALDDEPLVVEAFESGEVVRRAGTSPVHVLGPYYAHAAALVPVGSDVLVVWGAPHGGLDQATDGDLVELSRFAAETLVDVAPAKRLADELEALNAVRDLLHLPAETYEEALQRLVDQATVSLSCDLGVLYVREHERVAISDQRGGMSLERDGLLGALREIDAIGRFPICRQEAAAEELPEPFRSTDGVFAYYLLELERPEPGFLLLLHTVACAPRGFTQLCQSLGVKLVEAAEPLLTAALLRDTMREELSRVAAEARRDPLTGLANRLAWNEALAASNADENEPVSIVQLDCRGLKHLNDTQGHHVGDTLLCDVAVALSASVREHDLVARLGGDEFGILLCGADERMAARVVERIEAAVRADRGSRPPIALAIGTATARDGDLEGAQRRADAAMLEAKRVPNADESAA
jgi:diguanylate cyclase (GGDEF)-like protein